MANLQRRTPLNDGFVMTEFGSAEQFKGGSGYEGTFYSHQYDEQGKADVIAAAQDYIRRTTSNDIERKIAEKLLEQEGADTDLYRLQSEERWIVYADDIVTRAKDIRSVL